MRRFLGSGWFPFLICLAMAGTSVAAYALLKPTGADVGNAEIVHAFTIAGWAAGPAIGLVSLMLIGILNLLRRMMRMRRVNLLHPVTILLGILPWLVFGWALTGEPPFTPFARAAIAFVGRPMLWGALVATLLTLLLSTPLLFRAKK